MVPKLNPVMSLNRGNSNQVNPNEVTTVKRQKAGDKIFVNRLIKKKKKKSPWYSRQCWTTWQSKSHCEWWNVINQNPIDQVICRTNSRFYWHRSRYGKGDLWKQWVWKTVSELIISIHLWLKSHDNEAMELYLTLSKIQIFKTLKSQSDLDYQD